jgi:hydroxymethylpyrimidine/phosphomethylpyrimidine kinase
VAATSIPRALTIAGSDSGGGAGIQADLKTFCAFGVYGMSALTAVTAQNTLGVSGVAVLTPDMVTAQIRAVVEDIGVDATKTGMLANAAIVRAVAEAVRRGGLGPLVVDPVMVSKHGDLLLEEEARAALRDELLPLATVVTPNVPEAAALLGCRPEELEGLEARRQAAAELLRLGPRHVVLKGGHGSADPAEAVDIWYDGLSYTELRAPRLRSRHTHGTGCTFSAAVTAGLARGLDVGAALREAKSFVTWALEHAPGLGRGHGPLNHLRPWAAGRGAGEGGP